MIIWLLAAILCNPLARHPGISRGVIGNAFAGIALDLSELFFHGSYP